MGNILERKRTEFLFFAGFVFSFIAFRIWVLLVGGIDILYEALGIIFCMMFLVGLCIYRMRRTLLQQREALERQHSGLPVRPGQYRFSSRLRSSDHVQYSHLDDIHEIRRLCAAFPRIIYQAGQLKSFSKTLEQNMRCNLDDSISCCVSNKSKIINNNNRKLANHDFNYAVCDKNKVFIGQDLDLETGVDLELSTFSSSLPSSREEVDIAEDESQTAPLCSICLSDYVEGDSLMMLPCCHHFHDKCVLDWIDRKTECPLCKLDLRRVIATSRALAAESAAQQMSNPPLQNTLVTVETPGTILQTAPVEIQLVSSSSSHLSISKMSRTSASSSKLQSPQVVILDIPRNIVAVQENLEAQISLVENQTSGETSIMKNGEEMQLSVERRQQVSFVYLESSGNGKTLLAINI